MAYPETIHSRIRRSLEYDSNTKAPEFTTQSFILHFVGTCFLAYTYQFSQGGTIGDAVERRIFGLLNL